MLETKDVDSIDKFLSFLGVIVDAHCGHKKNECYYDLYIVRRPGLVFL